MKTFFFWLSHAASRILVPQPGIEPTLPALEGEVLTTGPPGESVCFLSLIYLIFPMSRPRFFFHTDCVSGPFNDVLASSPHPHGKSLYLPDMGGHRVSIRSCGPWCLALHSIFDQHFSVDSTTCLF